MVKLKKNLHIYNGEQHFGLNTAFYHYIAEPKTKTS